ncbi:MAG TPA: SRPBCC domain-containing protein [bacterium]|nr:SRPBCC domain-containing protein [bacterium]
MAMLPALTAQHQVRAEVEINAPAELVWQILTDLAWYPIWNPYIYPATGEIRAGSQLDITLHSDTGVIEFQPTVVAIQPNRLLRWHGQTLTLGVFDRDQTFTLEPIGSDRSRLIAQEAFTGLLTSISGNVQGDAQRGLDEMSRALRDRAEIMHLTLGARR